MTPQKQGRGRPKGTGLNDAAQLRAIAGLIAADPELKPTTAIKKIGVTDPSAIRRLRDKYAAVSAALEAEIAPRLPLGDDNSIKTQPSPASARENGPAQPCLRSLPLISVKPECKVEPVVLARAIATPVVPQVLTLPASEVAPTIGPLTKPFPTEPSPLAERRAQRPQHIQSPSETDLPNWMGVGLSMYALSFEAQFAVIGTMFQWPPVAAVLKSHIAFTELAVAMTTSVVSSSRIG